MFRKINTRLLLYISILTIAISIIPCQKVSALENNTPSEQIYIKEPSLPENIRMSFNEKEAKVIPSNNLYELTTEINENQYETTIYAVPIKYIDNNGDVQYIDTSLTASSKEGYDYEVSANSFTVSYSKNINKGLQVDNAFSVSIPSTNSNNAQVSINSNKNTNAIIDKTKEGNGRVIYPCAFGSNTYVEYININSGYKENIVLEKNININRFTFNWQSDSHIPVLAKDKKTIEIVSKDNPNVVEYLFCPIYVHDSYTVTDNSTKEELAYKHFTEDGYYEIIKNELGKYTIDYIIPSSFLNNPQTIYPVIIDPTIIATRSQTNIEDSFVMQRNPTANYGSYDYLRFGYSNGKIFSYLRFISLDVPSNATITEARLRLTFRSGQTSGSDGICYIVTESQWSENSITWNNQPYGAWGYTSSHHNYQYYDFDATEFVEGWHSGTYPNYGVDFTYTNETYNDYNSVVSSEGETSRAPRLTITYTVPGPTTGIISGKTYYIRSTYSNKYLSNTYGNASITQNSITPNISDQKWRVDYVGNGLYTFYSLRSSQYLSIKGGTMSNGTLLGVSSTPQTFKITQTGNAYFITPNNSNLVLDVYGPSTNEDTVIQLYRNDNVAQQKWYFETMDTAKSKSLTNEKTILLESNDHGWTSIKICYDYNEYCNTFENTEIYMHRSLYVSAESSRPSYDTPYGFYISNIMHENTSEQVIHNFNMSSYSSMHPVGLWIVSPKENRDFITYSNTHTNRGRFTISTSGSIVPYGETFRLDLAY